MAAYIIFIRDGAVRDPSAMEDYSKAARSAGGGHKLEPLVAYGKVEALEGAPADGVVVLKFPDMDQAKAWYNSPGYQAAVPHRMRGASYLVMVTEGV